MLEWRDGVLEEDARLVVRHGIHPDHDEVVRLVDGVLRVEAIATSTSLELMRTLFFTYVDGSTSMLYTCELTIHQTIG